MQPYYEHLHRRKSGRKELDIGIILAWKRDLFTLEDHAFVDYRYSAQGSSATGRE